MNVMKPSCRCILAVAAKRQERQTPSERRSSSLSPIRHFLVLVLLLFISGWTTGSLQAQQPASDLPKSNPEVKVTSVGEQQQLLDRIAQLEKRLAEIEARQTPPARAQGVAAPTPSAPAPSVPAAAAESVPGEKKVAEPFAFADFTWLTGNPRTKESPIDSKIFTGEIRFDTAFHQSFSNPKDHTISGSSEVFRSSEVQVAQIGVGGD